MGSIAARKLESIVENVRAALAIELLTAAQGIEQRRPLRAGQGVEAAHAAIRASVPALDDDRPLYADIAQVSALIESGELLGAVSRSIGALE
jgi:histidine ammonia-lyase